ncbi:VOC family protein [Flammeovirga sp. SubArs3]|uniref:VOC family protein n=1 Tax=Flammeovirga sp. SubArs3 TaxID=2995316 RepID=UPI00248C1356|nr:VOC family protein [Flammeovirga sp. SubArs3]
MQPNHFIFADLSTYDPNKSMEFYASIFNWKFKNEYDYQTAYLGNQPVIGLYETPEKFKQLKMPHFWMSYIQVNDVEKTVSLARTLGGIIELEQELDYFGKVALIRDPLGAGFTVYEGNYLMNTRTKAKENTLVWNELHVSDAKKVLPFYQGIFNWQLHKISNDTYHIFDDKERHIADILEVPNFYKGKYEYWVCTFGVRSLSKVKQQVLDQGGTIIHTEDHRVLVSDDSGEAFFYLKEV